MAFYFGYVYGYDPAPSRMYYQSQYTAICIYIYVMNRIYMYVYIYNKLVNYMITIENVQVINFCYIFKIPCKVHDFFAIMCLPNSNILMLYWFVVNYAYKALKNA